jgi:hypothetical protein
MEEIKVDTCLAKTVKHAAPLPWLVRLVVSSLCRLGWSSLRGVGWAGRLVVSSRCRLGWSSRGVCLACCLVMWALKFKRKVLSSQIYKYTQDTG